jgi:hypothetical protein
VPIVGLLGDEPPEPRRDSPDACSTAARGDAATDGGWADLGLPPVLRSPLDNASSNSSRMNSPFDLNPSLRTSSAIRDFISHEARNVIIGSSLVGMARRHQTEDSRH